jgi:hypothetical protein
MYSRIYASHGKWAAELVLHTHLGNALHTVKSVLRPTSATVGSSQMRCYRVRVGHANQRSEKKKTDGGLGWLAGERS